MSLLAAGRLWMRGVAALGLRSGPFATAVAIDVNRARVPELMLLDGIGRRRAEQIVLHRVRYGPFRRVEDLMGVDGIGPETLVRLRPFLRDLAP